MSEVIAQPFDCNTVCVPSGTASVPGPEGPPGADGAAGTDGVNAFALAAGSEAMPDGTTVSNTVTITTTTSTSWMVAGQFVYVYFWGYMQVMAVPTSTTVTLLNPEDGTGVYATNSPPGTILPVGAKISPAGLQGLAGTADSSLFLQIANNLNDVANVATSRGNLGLGTIATFNQGVANGQVPNIIDGGGIGANEFVVGTGAGIEGLTVAQVKTTLGFTIGIADTNIPPVDDASGLTNGEALFATATGIESQTPSVARTSLRAFAVNQGILGVNGAINFNSSGDYLIPIPQGAAGYIIDNITIYNSSLNLTTATAGVFTSTGGGGVTLAADQVLTALTTGVKFLDLALEAVVGTDWRTETSIYLKVGTPQGAAALGAVVVYGRILSV